MMSAGLEELLGGRFTVERNISYLVQVKSLILLVMVVGHLAYISWVALVTFTTANLTKHKRDTDRS
jgi:hypothetical protein